MNTDIKIETIETGIVVDNNDTKCRKRRFNDDGDEDIEQHLPKRFKSNEKDQP